MRGLARIFAGVAALLVLVAGAFLFTAYRFTAEGPLAADTIVEIPRGAGLSTIADRLEQAGVIGSRWVFVGGVLFNGQDRALQAGEYAFPAAVSAAGAMEILRSGRTVARAVTVPEGLTSAEIVALLAAEPLLAGEVASIPPEGSLLPETYNFMRGDSRAALIERMRVAMEAVLAEAWQSRAADLPFETPAEAVTLASIIEKETGVAAERRMVASVFVNRLRAGMPLQSDPTVIFALTGGRTPLDRELLRVDWEFESPYNTYRVNGLPPGPIANPGRASIEAALHPAESDFLYFVADGSGGHAFAVSLEEHNRNVERWRRIRDGRQTTEN